MLCHIHPIILSYRFNLETDLTLRYNSISLRREDESS